MKGSVAVTGDKVRLGCIGCGWALRDLYLPALGALGNGVPAAVCDVDPARARSPWRMGELSWGSRYCTQGEVSRHEREA